MRDLKLSGVYSYPACVAYPACTGSRISLRTVLPFSTDLLTKSPVGYRKATF